MLTEISRQKRYQGTDKGKEAYRKATGKYWTKKYLESEYGITLEELDRIIQNYQTFITECVPREGG